MNDLKMLPMTFKSILMLYCDNVLQPPLHLSTHIIEGKHKIQETNQKSKEIEDFCPICWYIWGRLWQFH